MSQPAVVAMASIPIAPRRTGEESQRFLICWHLRKSASCIEREAIESCHRRVGHFARAPRLHPPHTESVLSHSTFLNRLALHLRPDPARVIVRPFKPATEPRDLNPTDKTRANHIVDRVLALSSEDAAAHLADVLENFQGRHRNLLAQFESRSSEMEDAFADHA